MARRSPTGRFPALRQGQRRESLWIPITETLGSYAAANVVILLNSLNAAALALRPFTIVRSRIWMHAVSDNLTAVEDYQVALGMAVVSDQASAIGVTAIPTPFTDAGSDLWFFYEVIASEFIFISGVGFDSAGGIMKDADSKAMRKVQDGEDVVLVGEASGLSLGCRMTQGGRFLIKLH